MAYSYNRLWKLMIDKKINKTTLRREAGITSNAMAKLGKDLPVNVEVLAKICRVELYGGRYHGNFAGRRRTALLMK